MISRQLYIICREAATDPKIGITIGYGLDIIGFATIFFSGGFDFIYKGSLAAVEALENEIKSLKVLVNKLENCG